MKVSELMKATLSDIQSLSEADLRSAFLNVRRSLTVRGHAFEKAGIKQDVPKSVQQALAAGENVTRKQLEKAVGAAGGYFRGKTSTAKGKAAIIQEHKQQIKERLGKPDMSDSQYDQYGKFMGEMQSRYKENWKYVSFQAQQIAAAAAMKNIDNDTFLQNYEYWMNNDIDFEEMILERQDSEESDMIDEWYQPGEDLTSESHHAETRSGRPSKHRSGRQARQARQARTGRKRGRR